VPNLGRAVTPGVVEGADGALYGTQAATEFFRLTRDGSSFAVVHALSEPPSAQPEPVALARAVTYAFTV